MRQKFKREKGKTLEAKKEKLWGKFSHPETHIQEPLMSKSMYVLLTALRGYSRATARQTSDQLLPKARVHCPKILPVLAVL